MRALLLLVLVLPPAGAWSVDVAAPALAGAGLPFVAVVCVEADAPGAQVSFRMAEARAQFRWGDATVAAGRYAPAFPLDGRTCRDVEVSPDDVEANATLEVRARPPGGSAKASARVPVQLVRGEVGLLPDGSVVPLLPGAASEATPLRVALADAWAPPFAGIVLRNDGDAPARLAGLALAQGTRQVALPDVTIAPGEHLLVGPRAPPDGTRHADAPAPWRAGEVTLLVARRALDALDVPKLDAGAALLGRYGRTSFAPASVAVEGRLDVFRTPDAGAAPVVSLVDGARREALLEGYTLTSEDVAAALARAAQRGVDVRVLLEGAAVGGVPPEEPRLLRALADAGARVRLLASADGFPTRYATVHAKTLVVDGERVLVSTENFHDRAYPAQPGGAGSRGFGVIVHDASVARVFADAFHQDAAPWPDVQPPRALPPSDALLPRAGAGEGEVARLSGRWNVTPLFAPDASLAADGLLGALAGAESRIDVAMLFADLTWGDEPNPFLEALLDAARRGVHVRLLLDGAVDDGGNRATAAALARRAEREALPLEARVDASGRMLHAKMVAVDGRAAYVGSMNWGRASAMENREAGVLVEGEEVAAWLHAAFEEDWSPPPRAPAREVPAWSGGAVAVAVVAAALTCRRRSRRR